MTKRSVLSIIVAMVLVFTAVFSAAGTAFAAGTTKSSLSSYAGVYTLKQGSTTVAKVTVKYEGSVLSVSSNGKAWYNLVLKAGTTYTMPKLPGITIEFLKGDKMKYTQNGMFSIVLTGKKTGKPATTTTKTNTVKVDLKKLAGNYAMEYKGKSMGTLNVKYENDKLYISPNNGIWYECVLIAGTTNSFTAPKAPGYKAIFPSTGKVKYVMPNGAELEGTRQ